MIEKAFKGDLYFHEINFGGEKGNYSKLTSNIQYYCNKNNYREIHYKLNKKSLIYKAKHEESPAVVLSLNSFCNTLEDGILSVCCMIETDVNRDLELIYECNNYQIPYIDSVNIVKEKDYFGSLKVPKSSYNNTKFVLKDKFY